MKQLQIKDLYECCKEQMDKGYGDKFIVVADDNEGNGYHGMFFGFTEDTEDCESLLRDSVAYDPDKIIILG